jgi:hypothetical protein
MSSMGRRLFADGLVHALNRGNNRATVFSGAADFMAFLKALTQTKERYPFRGRPPRRKNELTPICFSLGDPVPAPVE